MNELPFQLVVFSLGVWRQRMPFTEAFWEVIMLGTIPLPRPTLHTLGEVSWFAPILYQPTTTTWFPSRFSRPFATDSTPKCVLEGVEPLGTLLGDLLLCERRSLTLGRRFPLPLEAQFFLPTPLARSLWWFLSSASI